MKRIIVFAGMMLVLAAALILSGCTKTAPTGSSTEAEPTRATWQDQGDLCMVKQLTSHEEDEHPVGTYEGWILFERGFGAYMMRQDGSEQRSLTWKEAFEKFQPEAREDEMSVVVSDRYKGDDILVINGEERHFLGLQGRFSQIYGDACLSPDGGQVVFSATTKERGHDIYRVRVDGLRLHPLTYNRADDWDPVYVGDGYIAFARNRDVFLMDLNRPTPKFAAALGQ